MIKFKNLTIALLLLSNMASAQKLPKIQENGVWDEKIKADASFQAYNKATNIWYTLSNDNKNLYLTVKATDPIIIDKIVTSGITLTINQVSVSFPAYDKENKAIFEIMTNAPTANSPKVDTFISVRNLLMNSRQKIIRVAYNGTDEDLSIYNDKGIKVNRLIAADLTYTQQFTIPLTYLEITTTDKFTYQIQLNGQMPKGAKPLNVGRPDIISYTGADGKDYMIGRATPENLILAYPTNLKATYTLAKK